MVFKALFGLGELVFLKTDVQQDAWMVTQVRFNPDGTTYYLSRGADSYVAYEIEISAEKDVLKCL